MLLLVQLRRSAPRRRRPIAAAGGAVAGGAAGSAPTPRKRRRGPVGSPRVLLRVVLLHKVRVPRFHVLTMYRSLATTVHAAAAPPQRRGAGARSASVDDSHLGDENHSQTASAMDEEGSATDLDALFDSDISSPESGWDTDQGSQANAPDASEQAAKRLKVLTEEPPSLLEGYAGIFVIFLWRTRC